ncbi:MAG TPA: DUF5673 domain-containing protein [Thermoanaerobaculia bacterium]|nr:DUF5673 domain-containing protein [Thermoanaerobaculia bacterium]
MITDLSVDAQRLAIRNALVCSAVLAAAVLAAALGFAVLLGQPAPSSILLGFASVVGATYLLILGKWLQDRRRAGAVLLDCGPNAGQRSLRTSAVTFFTMGVALNVLDRFFPHGSVIGWLFMVQAVVMALMALRRFQLREHGLWFGISLLAWDKIESYGWDERGALTLRTKGSLWSFKKGVVRVPPECLEAVDRWLGKRVAQG